MQVLALRDEFASRSFDVPGEWWPEHPGVIGGRDQRAGGTWCVSHVASGVTAVVLNRPEKMVAGDGAPSRGILPLLAIEHGQEWVDHVDVEPMAGFNLVRVTPTQLHWWSWDGTSFADETLPAGTHMITPLGLREKPLSILLADGHFHDSSATGAARTEDAWPEWVEVVRIAKPTPDRTGSLVVQRHFENDVYETVFGQLIAARPGELRLDYLERVARDPRGPWTTRSYEVG